MNVSQLKIELEITQLSHSEHYTYWKQLNDTLQSDDPKRISINNLMFEMVDKMNELKVLIKDIATNPAKTVKSNVLPSY